MYCFTCEPNLDAMLSCIYEANSCGKGHENIKLMLEPIDQLSLFDEYIHVEPDADKVSRVMDAINIKISPAFYQTLVYSSMAYEEDILDNIYHCIILGFHFGETALNMIQYEDIMRNQIIRRRLDREVNRFQEAIRFNQIGHTYVAHFEPKSRILPALGPIFEDRMPSEHWMIVDDIHKSVLVHPKDEHFYIYELDELEFDRLRETESVNDEYSDMWKAFFNAIAIKERYNKRCQDNLFPLWARKHAIEFD